MIIKKAKFITSAQKLSQCPDFGLPEVALLGRSNVGKSSFINAITNNSKLAKTSNKPGKTRLINLFNFDDKYIVIDTDEIIKDRPTDNKNCIEFREFLKKKYNDSIPDICNEFSAEVIWHTQRA